MIPQCITVNGFMGRNWDVPPKNWGGGEFRRIFRCKLGSGSGNLCSWLFQIAKPWPIAFCQSCFLVVFQLYLVNHYSLIYMYFFTIVICVVVKLQLPNNRY